MEKSIIIANITYNPTGWRNPYINPKAGHSYVKKFPGHESFNFNFNKKNVDSFKNIFGYIQCGHLPKNFKKNGTIIFYSKNTTTNKGEIVGIYCNVTILQEDKKVSWKWFENNEIRFNLKADKELSLLFPIPLNDKKYKKLKWKRLVGQIWYSYYDNHLAESIILDELYELNKSGIQQNEFNKLRKIYSFISGNNFNLNLMNIDEIEQEELIHIYKKKDRIKIIDDLSNLKETEHEKVFINQKTYKRDNKTIAQIKILRNFECQICKTKIKKAKWWFYIEAAHIKPKNKEGREIPDNILILCPNHHKEFDFGKLEIINQNKNFIEFRLNGKIYKLNLKIE